MQVSKQQTMKMSTTRAVSSHDLAQIEKVKHTLLTMAEKNPELQLLADSVMKFDNFENEHVENSKVLISLLSCFIQKLINWLGWFEGVYFNAVSEQFVLGSFS